MNKALRIGIGFCCKEFNFCSKTRAVPRLKRLNFNSILFSRMASAQSEEKVLSTDEKLKIITKNLQVSLDSHSVPCSLFATRLDEIAILTDPSCLLTML